MVRSVLIRTTAEPTRFTAAVTKLLELIGTFAPGCWATIDGAVTIGESDSACEGDTLKVLTLTMTPRAIANIWVMSCRIERGSFTSFITSIIQLAGIPEKLGDSLVRSDDLYTYFYSCLTMAQV